MTVECIRGCLIEGPQLFEVFPELSSFTVFTKELSRFTAERFTDVPPLSFDFDFEAEALGLSQSMHAVLSGSGL